MILVWDTTTDHLAPGQRYGIGYVVLILLFFLSIGNTLILMYKLIRSIIECCKRKSYFNSRMQAGTVVPAVGPMVTQQIVTQQMIPQPMMGPATFTPDMPLPYTQTVPMAPMGAFKPGYAETAMMGGAPLLMPQTVMAATQAPLQSTTRTETFTTTGPELVKPGQLYDSTTHVKQIQTQSYTGAGLPATEVTKTIEKFSVDDRKKFTGVRDAAEDDQYKVTTTYHPGRITEVTVGAPVPVRTVTHLKNDQLGPSEIGFSQTKNYSTPQQVLLPDTSQTQIVRETRVVNSTDLRPSEQGKAFDARLGSLHKLNQLQFEARNSKDERTNGWNNARCSHAAQRNRRENCRSQANAISCCA